MRHYVRLEKYKDVFSDMYLCYELYQIQFQYIPLKL